MKISPKRLASWYRHPDRELLRREAQWTLRWLRSAPGLGFLGAYTALLFAQRILSSIFFSPGNQATLPRYQMLTLAYSSSLPTLFLYAGVIHLLRRRMMAPLAEGRIADLVLTQLDRKTLWPALLAAPVLLSAAAYTSVVALALVGWIWPSSGARLQPEPLGLLTTVARWLIQDVLWLLRGFATSVAACAAVSAFASVYSVPKGGTVRLALFVLLGHAILSVVSGLTSYSLFTYIWMPTSEVNRWALLLFGLLISAFYLLLCGGLFYFSLKGLRSDRMWDKLRASAERTESHRQG